MKTSTLLRLQRSTQRSHLLSKFDVARTAFLCCDIQEKLRNKIDNFNDAVYVSNVMTLVHEQINRVVPGASIYCATTQHPEKVGPLVSEITLPSDALSFAKREPSMLSCGVRTYILGDSSTNNSKNEIQALQGVQQVVLWGHETHVCILQTANELLSHGIFVAILVDGCSAQEEIDHSTSITAMSQWSQDGLVLTTTRSAVMQLSQGDDRLMSALFKFMRKELPRKDKEKVINV